MWMRWDFIDLNYLEVSHHFNIIILFQTKNKTLFVID